MKKTAIITGGSRGIGFGCALALAKDGYNIAILDVNAQADYQHNLDQLTEAGAEYLYMQGDNRDTATREAFVNAVCERFGDIDVLVNNAGVAPKVRQDILLMTEESFDYVVDTNTKSTMFMTQLVANRMIKQEMKGRRRGVIVNITSSSVTISSTSRGEYCIAKAGMAMITTLFADRLAEHDIQVYEIRPGIIDTDMTKVVHKKYDDLIKGGLLPNARWGYPEDIGDAVSAFCSDKFLYSTGNYIDLDGGMHIKRL